MCYKEDWSKLKRTRGETEYWSLDLEKIYKNEPDIGNNRRRTEKGK